MSNQDNQLLYSREEDPLGDSWENWTIKWWQWIYSTPDRENIVNDVDGTLHKSDNQPQLKNSKVWFLAATHSPKVERKCNIPAESL